MNALLHELDHRDNDGIDIRLMWREPDDRAVVVVDDVKTGEHFEIEVGRHESPLDVFWHPYAYAAWRGIEPEVERAA